MEYELVVGLETHAEIYTKSKGFCTCKVSYKDKPNSNTCEMCGGYIGAFPLLNKEVVKSALKMGIALNMNINKRSSWDRKNYFYVDLAKGYQITQDRMPILTEGYLDVEVENSLTKEKGIKRVDIERIHIEEDTAKLNQNPFDDEILMDLNRSGIALIEIVSKPVMHSKEEVVSYLNEIQKLLIYLGINEGKFEEGQIRSDVNISVHKKGEELGGRIEIKNMSSFKSIERAIDYEFNRHLEKIKKGEKILQQTLGWDDIKGETFVMRTKESAKDYRYFPDPNMPDLVLTDELIDEVKNNMPEMLWDKKKRYISLGLSNKAISYILSNNRIIELFEKTNKIVNNPEKIANLIISDIARYINDNLESPNELKLDENKLAIIVKKMENGELNSNFAKIVLNEVLKENKDVETIIKEKGLTVIGENETKEIINKVLNENEQSIIDIKNGKNKAFGFLVGMCMKEGKGKVDPKMVNELLKIEIEKRIL